jgi:hypothetical protein
MLKRFTGFGKSGGGEKSASREDNTGSTDNAGDRHYSSLLETVTSLNNLSTKTC